jgi:hypothetical protein
MGDGNRQKQQPGSCRASDGDGGTMPSQLAIAARCPLGLGLSVDGCIHRFLVEVQAAVDRRWESTEIMGRQCLYSRIFRSFLSSSCNHMMPIIKLNKCMHDLACRAHLTEHPLWLLRRPFSRAIQQQLLGVHTVCQCGTGGMAI